MTGNDWKLLGMAGIDQKMAGNGWKLLKRADYG